MRRNSSVVTSAFSLFAFQDIITSVMGIMVLITLLLAVELINRTEASPPAQTRQQLEVIQQTNALLDDEISSLQTRLTTASAELADLPISDEEELRCQLASTQAQSQRARKDVDSARKRSAAKKDALASAGAKDRKAKQSQESELLAIEQEIQRTEATLQSVESSDRVLFKSGIKDKATWIVEVTGSSLRVAKIGDNNPPLTLASNAAFSTWLYGRQRSSEALYMIGKPPNASDRFCELRDEVLAAGFEMGYTLVAGDQQVLDPQVGAGIP